MARLLKLNPFNSVAANEIATVQYEGIGTSTFGFELELGGPTFDETHINGITVKAPGGKVIVPNISGARLRKMIEYDNYGFAVTNLQIMFGDSFASALPGKLLGNFDHTIYPGPMTIEVDIGAAVAPTLAARAIAMAPKIALGFPAVEAAQHRVLLETIKTYSAAVAGEPIDMSIGSAAGARIKKIFVHHTGALTSLEVLRQGDKLWEDASQALADFVNDDVFGRVKQTNMYVWDAIPDGDYSALVRTIRANRTAASFQFKPTVSGAETLTAYTDLIAALPLI